LEAVTKMTTPARGLEAVSSGLDARTSAMLARLPLFAGLPHNALHVLAGVLKTRWVAPDEDVFREGDRASAAYILLSGEVVIEKVLADGRQERLATLGHGALFGEVALIDGRPRSATARPHEGAAVLLVLERQDFERIFMANRPFAFKLIDRIVTDLSLRLRQATDQLVQANSAESAMLRSARARQAAASALGLHDEAGLAALDDVDLDAVTFEIQGAPRRQGK